MNRRTKKVSSTVLTLALAGLVSLVCAPAFATLNWCGNTTQPSNIQINQTVTIYSEVYPDYFGTHAEIKYTTNNWVTTVTQSMSYDSHVGNNGRWVGTIGSFQGGVIVQFYIHFYDDWGSSCDDNNSGNDYEFKINWTSNTGWPNVGYPSGNGFYYLEGLVGNNYTAVHIDRAGSVHDMFYPTVGVRSKMATATDSYPNAVLNVKHITGGIKNSTTTHWISFTENFSTYTQTYTSDSNVLLTTAVPKSYVGPFEIYMYDFSPKNPDTITFPNVKNSSEIIRGIYLRRFLVKNTSDLTQQVTFFYNANLNLNGGASYDYALWDDNEKYIMSWDSKWRKAETGSHPWPDYVKDCSIAFGIALKKANVSLSESRPDGFGIDGDYQLVSDVQGWVAKVSSIPANSIVEFDAMLVAAFSASTLAHQSLIDNHLLPAVTWFYNQDIAYLHNQTEKYWQSWISSSTIIDTPSEQYDTVYKRSLLVTALHYDETYGGIVAGYTNGNYAYVWPRDAVFAALTLDRAGHTDMTQKTYEWLSTVERGGNEFFWQKYMTDGIHLWESPQVDETALVPYGFYHHYLQTGSTSFLNTHWEIIKDASYVSSQDSGDANLYYDENTKQMFSYNIWEDQTGEFLYSNATVEAGLRAGATIGYMLGYNSDANTFVARSTTIHQGNLERVDYFLTHYSSPPTVDMQTDSSLLYLCLLDPYKVLAATESRMTNVESQVYNYCVMSDTGNPTVKDFLRRYNGPTLYDTYFNGGPWVNTTLFHAQYFMEKADVTNSSGTAEMDTAKIYKLDRVLSFLGNLGLSSEQVEVRTSPDGNNFNLEAAWPNTWESNSTFVDTMYKFVDPDYNSRNSQLVVEPKLPSVWSVIGSTLILDSGKFWVRLDHGSLGSNKIKTWMKNSTIGKTIKYVTYLKLPNGKTVSSVTINGSSTSNWSSDANTQRVKIWDDVGNGSTDSIEVNLE